MASVASQSPLKVLIVDDHRLFVDGLARLLDTLDKPMTVAKCHSASQAIFQLEHHRFDLLLVDLLMPGIDGLDFLKAKFERGVKTPVAVVSSTEDLDVISWALKHGASGFIPKSASSEVMLAAIETVLQGDLYLPDDLWERLDILDSKRPETSPLKENILVGFRQLEVLELLAQGKTNKQISTILAVSESTVKYHVSILFRVLDVRNRTSCINKALSLKLIDSVQSDKQPFPE